MSTDFPKSERGDPTWEMSALFPKQGYWSERDYLLLDAGRLVEFDNGKVEVQSMPTELHQAIALYLCFQLRLYADALQLGVAYVAPLRVQLWQGKFREPDVLFMRTENRHRRTPQFWCGADLVMEVISEVDPQRDLVVKREEYAQAGIPEYWIVDPRDHSITILTLDASQPAYTESSRSTDAESASSVLLPGFNVIAREVFDRPEAI